MFSTTLFVSACCKLYMMTCCKVCVVYKAEVICKVFYVRADDNILYTESERQFKLDKLNKFQNWRLSWESTILCVIWNLLVLAGGVSACARRGPQRSMIFPCHNSPTFPQIEKKNGQASLKPVAVHFCLRFSVHSWNVKVVTDLLSFLADFRMFAAALGLLCKQHVAFFWGALRGGSYRQCILCFSCSSPISRVALDNWNEIESLPWKALLLHSLL